MDSSLMTSKISVADGLRNHWVTFSGEDEEVNNRSYLFFRTYLMPGSVGDVLHILPPCISFIPISQRGKNQSSHGFWDWTGEWGTISHHIPNCRNIVSLLQICSSLLCFWLLLPSTGWRENYEERCTENTVLSLLLVDLGLKNRTFLEFCETSEKASVISLVLYLWSGCRIPSWVVRILGYNCIKAYRFSQCLCIYSMTAVPGGRHRVVTNNSALLWSAYCVTKVVLRALPISSLLILTIEDAWIGIINHFSTWDKETTAQRS